MPCKDTDCEACFDAGHMSSGCRHVLFAAYREPFQSSACCGAVDAAETHGASSERCKSGYLSLPAEASHILSDQSSQYNTVQYSTAQYST